jgi:hypothetical protein
VQFKNRKLNQFCNLKNFHNNQKNFIKYISKTNVAIRWIEILVSVSLKLLGVPEKGPSICKINDFIFYLFIYIQQQSAYNLYTNLFLCFGFICNATTTTKIVILFALLMCYATFLTALSV